MLLHAATEQASAWVQRFAPLISRGEVLDLACGSGRHSRLLAGLGHAVVAVDHDPEALARTAGPGIITLQLDLESGSDASWPFADGRFEGIIITNYLHRPLFPHILNSLAENGILIYETFACGNEKYGKPSNPAFLLRQGELLEIGRTLRIIAFEDGYISHPKAAMVQRICAMKAGQEVAPERLRLI